MDRFSKIILYSLATTGPFIAEFDSHLAAGIMTLFVCLLCVHTLSTYPIIMKLGVHVIKAIEKDVVYVSPRRKRDIETAGRNEYVNDLL